jgi:hypothetical protein
MKSSEPKQVLAIEYNGSLYPDLAAAETSRARDLLHKLLPGERHPDGICKIYEESGMQRAIEALLKHPHEVAAVFAKVVAAMGDKR